MAWDTTAYFVKVYVSLERFFIWVKDNTAAAAAAAAAKSLQSCPSKSVWPHRRRHIMLPHPWNSPGKNTGVGCHFLLQCMKVKSESEVTQLCPTLRDSMNCSLPGSSIHGIFQARVLAWGATQIVSHSYFPPCLVQNIGLGAEYYDSKLSMSQKWIEDQVLTNDKGTEIPGMTFHAKSKDRAFQEKT